MPGKPRRRRARPRHRSGRPWVWALVILVVAVAAALLWLREDPGLPPSSPAEEPAPAPSSPPPTPAPPVEPPPIYEEFPPEPTPAPTAVEPVPVAPGAARVALVIDDLGRSLQDLDRLEAFGVPVSYAVLPFETLTAEVAAEISRRGHELLCHLPMEASTGANPGPGALLQGLPRRELAQRTRAALAAVPGAVGVNNHMGSSLTADAVALKPVLQVIKKRDLFFLDSRTSAESVGYREARRLGIPAAQRQVFLDGDPSPEAIRTQFHRLLAEARRSGAAIAIGHPYPSTLSILPGEIRQARDLGYEFVPVSYLLDADSN